MSHMDIVQITDLHFGASVDSLLAGINPVDSFISVLEAIDLGGRGDNLLLLSGDLSGECSPQSYKILNQILKEQKKDVIWLPGNHDDVELMANHLVDFPRQRVNDVGDWSIITLDSAQLGTPVGHINDNELMLLSELLDQVKGRPVLFSMHHCPIALDCPWLDKQKINNPEKLYQLLTSFDNVKAVVTGHVHQQYDGFWGQLPLFTAPSSCIQFKRYSQQFAISNQKPGYRWFSLESTGLLSTGVEFLTDFNQSPDTSSEGY
jgi:Icc protein